MDWFVFVYCDFHLVNVLCLNFCMIGPSTYQMGWLHSDFCATKQSFDLDLSVRESMGGAGGR